MAYGEHGLRLLYGKMRRRVYIELPEQYPEATYKNKMGRLVKGDVRHMGRALDLE